MTVSVIMASYNYVHYVPRALDAIFLSSLLSNIMCLIDKLKLDINRNSYLKTKI